MEGCFWNVNVFLVERVGDLKHFLWSLFSIKSNTDSQEFSTKKMQCNWNNFLKFSILFSQISRMEFVLMDKWNYRSSHPEVFCKTGVLRNYAIFTRKHLCLSLFFKKVVDWNLQFYKKETLAQVFSYEFCEIFKNTFFTEHL